MNLIELAKKRFVKILFPFARLYWRVLKPHSEGARLILIRNERVLLVKTMYGRYWLFPGGGKNRAESPEACALRETREETGIEARILYKLGTYTSTAEGKRDTIHIFIGTCEDETITQEWELKETCWFPFAELPEDLSPAARRRLNEYRDGQQDLQLTW